MIKSLFKYIFFKIYAVGKVEYGRRLIKDNRAFFDTIATIAPDTVLDNHIKLHNLQNDKTKITFGAGSHIFGEYYIFPYGGKISVGENCFIGAGTRIWSGENISIGNNVMIGHNVNIIDFSHERNHVQRAEGFRNLMEHGHPAEKGHIPARPIKIEDDVIIYAGSTIVMGVTVGKGSIISAGSVVIKDVAPFSQVLGNPAKAVWKTT